MNESAIASSNAGTESVRLAENEHIKGLLGILQANGKDEAGLLALLDHVNSMEGFVKQAESKIADMKVQLDEMKEIQRHPIKAALRNTGKVLETRIAEVKERLTELKSHIVEGCKNAVAAFKDKGIVALDKLASFFRIKSCLQKIKNSAIADISDCDKALAQIDTFSKEYHRAGRSIFNMARLFVGMEPIDTVKENGKLAKALGAPNRGYKACMVNIRDGTSAMIQKLDQLSQYADAKRDEKATVAKRPPLMERLHEKKELVRQKKLERYMLERAPKTQEIDI
ncbi:MAG: hypothetical protein FWD84_00525 [Oscillospiraceae bacterium]|nr:hypothetical protein [Oscillospiraceae bacterium]